MIDPADKQTQALPLEPKRGRGRPATGAAMTPAEKQKAYRERQKKEAAADVDGQIKLLSHLLEQTREDNQRLAGKVVNAEEEVRRLKAQVVELKKGNVTKIKRHRDDAPIAIEEGIPDDGIWTIEFMMKGIGKRSWDTCTEPQIDFEGVPDKFEMVKRHVDNMNRKEVARNVWRAVRDDGLIYEPKAPKSKRKQPAKS